MKFASTYFKMQKSTHTSVQKSIQTHSDDDVAKSIAAFVQYMRTSPDHLELEIRVGEFMSDHSFVAGYDMRHIDVVKRLRTVLSAATKASAPNKWSVKISNQTMVKNTYGQLRRIYTLSNEDTDDGDEKTKVANELVQHKQRVSCVDVYTDRPYHLRCQLSRETNVKDPVDLSQVPDSVQLVQRFSVCETIDMGTTPLVVQWDISKVTPSARTKKEACDLPCRYHCEVELVTRVHPLGNQQLETDQNNFIAKTLLSRASWLLGTHSGDTALSPPKLLVLKR